MIKTTSFSFETRHHVLDKKKFTTRHSAFLRPGSKAPPPDNLVGAEDLLRRHLKSTGLPGRTRPPSATVRFVRRFGRGSLLNHNPPCLSPYTTF